jgi:hypothetical protein
VSAAVGLLAAGFPVHVAHQVRSGTSNGWSPTPPRGAKERPGWRPLPCWAGSITRGVKAVDVHASAQARALYEALGLSDPAARPMRRLSHP